MADRETELDDATILGMVKDERRRSIGFTHDQDLFSAREKALLYYKGEMPDVPSMENRSKAVSTDVADAIETALPDLVEIFTGGDDVMAFIPIGPEDEAGAQQETDYINHVVFDENSGFLVLYSMFKDALLQKTGLVKFWWESYEDDEEQTFTGKTPEDYAVAQATCAPNGYEISEPTQDETGVSFTVSRTNKSGCAKVKAVPPEDFTVASDTVMLADTTYCAMRSRPRAQQLIADGYDKDKIENLPGYGTVDNNSIELARDTAGEHQLGQNISGNGNLRTVEIIEHYIRIGDADGIDIWKVVTGGDESVLLDREKVERIPFAAVTPYMIPHRFYGRSVADLLLEIQRIKTALTRMFLDSGYFALNQRMEVSMEKANAFTISDLLRNEPGVPIRTKTGDAVRAISAGGLDFDAMSALEHFSTVAEGRTGIVRNAQGLKPDTLHDTASGAMALMNNAQKRLRLIARIFAETGLKDLFLGVHALIREHAEQPAVVRLRNKWVTVDPTKFGERSDMRIELGLGAGGKEHDLMMLNQQAGMLEKLVQIQGGTFGPLFTVQNAYNFGARYFEKTGSKTPEMFLTAPQPPDPNAPPPMPPPNPHVIEAQGKAQLAQQQAEAKAQADEAAAARKHELDLMSAQFGHQQKLAEIDGHIGLKRYQIDQELGLKAEQVGAELQLKGAQLGAEHELETAAVSHGMALDEAKTQHAMSLASTKVASDVEMGGEPG